MSNINMTLSDLKKWGNKHLRHITKNDHININYAHLCHVLDFKPCVFNYFYLLIIFCYAPKIFFLTFNNKKFACRLYDH